MPVPITPLVRSRPMALALCCAGLVFLSLAIVVMVRSWPAAPRSDQLGLGESATIGITYVPDGQAASDVTIARNTQHPLRSAAEQQKKLVLMYVNPDDVEVFTSFQNRSVPLVRLGPNVPDDATVVIAEIVPNHNTTTISRLTLLRVMNYELNGIEVPELADLPETLHKRRTP